MKKMIKIAFVTGLILFILPLVTMRAYGVFTKMKLKSFCRDLHTGMALSEFVNYVLTSHYQLVEKEPRDKSDYSFSDLMWDCNVHFENGKLNDRYFGSDGPPGNRTYLIEDLD